MKKARIALEILGPALLGTALLIAVKHEEFAAISFSPRVLVVYLWFAYAFALLPSIGYAFIMEAWLRRRPRHVAGSLITIGLSTVLGSLSGALVQLASEAPVTWIGGAVGLILGCILSVLSASKIPDAESGAAERPTQGSA